MDRISVLIPAYKESAMLEPLLKQLRADPYPEKEILVAIDKPTAASVELSKRMPNVKFLFNRKRRGKAAALNVAAKRASGNILFFLDSDMRLEGGGFLARLVSKMDGIDLVSLRTQVIRESFLSKMESYDYLNSNAFMELMARKLTPFCMNGAAFAVRKKAFEELGGFGKVVSEDFDMAMKSYLSRKKIRFAADLGVCTRTKSSWKEWLIQRKRWMAGTAEYFRNHRHNIVKMIRDDPKLFFSGFLYVFWPAFVLLAALPVNSGVLGNTLAMTFITLSMKFTALVPLVLAAGLSLMLLKNILVFLMLYTVSAAIFYTLSRRLHFVFRPLEYTLYFYLYTPFQIALCVYYFAMYLARLRCGEVGALSDWKV